MPVRDSYPAGMPCWVDLGTSDPAAARVFYGELFGWTAEVDERPEAGGYGQFFRDGLVAAGCGPLSSSRACLRWTTYIASDDADADAVAVVEHGGTLMVPPMDVFDAGRMAVFAGPDGAVAGLWQAGVHHGARFVTEPGGWSWNTLATRDKAASTAFYSAVFGWELVDHPEWGEHWSLGGGEIVGVLELGPGSPPQVPPHWQVVFMVADADAAISRAEEFGGKAHGPMLDMPMGGRLGGVADPQGAAFAVLSFPAST